MTLSALIRKRDTGSIATAIPAISATHSRDDRATVARIATVAVANPKEEQTAPPAKVGAGDTATDSPSCKTCTYVTGRGGCGNPVEAGLSNVPGVIRYHADDGMGCTVHKPSTVPTGIATGSFDTLPIPSHQTGRKNTPQDRIYAMTRLRDYSGDELALVLEGAKADPEGWLGVVTADEGCRDGEA